MAEPSIIRKLRQELTGEITTERQVVYLLAEVRKLLELRNEKQKYFALNFHCCWALHTRMDQVGAKRIVQQFDKAHATAIAKGHPDLSNVPADLQNEIMETMVSAKFRNEMEAYLSLHGLPIALTQKGDQWTRFLNLYSSEVIEECPLEMTLRACVFLGMNCVPPHSHHTTRTTVKTTVKVHFSVGCEARPKPNS